MVTSFTPLASLAGGIMIGLSAVLLMWMLGRIAGATGILTGLFFAADTRDLSWRAAMIAGMVSAPPIIMLITGKWPELAVPVSSLSLAIGGAIVGIGVTFSAGCTSGHGVCGLARLSPRSLAATLTFMATTAATVYVTRHIIAG